MIRRQIAPVLAGMAVVFVFLLAFSIPLGAQELVVTDCSSDAGLRARMDDIEAQGEGIIRIVCAAAPGTILLNGTPLPTIHSNMTIIGNAVTISGNNNTTLFTVESDGALTLRGVNLTRAVAASDGGAIASRGSLTIVDSQIYENRSLAGNGGAIVAWGPVTIRNVLFGSNTANNGGAIHAYIGATLTIDGANFSDNLADSGIENGGALVLIDGSHRITNSVFLRNRAHYGAGIYVNTDASLDVENTRFIENASGNGGSAILYNGDLTVRRSSFVGQSSTDMGTGGVLSGVGSLLVENSLFSGNIGPAIEPYGSGPTEIRFSTIVDGRSAGYQAGYGILTGNAAVTLHNTILANNSGNNCQIYGTGTLVSLGNNLSSDATCAIAETGDRTNTDPLLGPLQGGAESPHYLIPQPNSPAIDAGVCLPAIPVDLRGYNRPAGPACDIGAIEVGATPTRYVFAPIVRK